LIDLLNAIILGVIQGLTEFLPISSTGHLVLGRNLMGLSEAGLFLDTMLHFGTLVAVVTVFWQDILYMIRNPFSKLSLLIIAGTIPTAIIGLTFQDYFEEISVTGVTIGWEFIATGFILWFADGIKNKGNKQIDEITFGDAIFIGTLQGAAILPAISRSGLTIAGALFRRIDRGVAARFSFLLSLPAILGAVVLQGKDVMEATTVTGSIGLIPIIVGTIAAGLSGYIAVKWMVSILQRGSLKPFAIYVWVLAVVILVMQFTGNW
jgi:undecaprenyl-diphosphatase